MNSDEILKTVREGKKVPYNPAGYSLAPWRQWLTDEESAWINKRHHERWQEDRLIPRKKP
jgi:hypothetical protein